MLRTIASRLITGILNAVAAFILIGALELLLAARKGVTDYSIVFLNSYVLWGGALIFFMLGFVLGPEKVAHIWGAIFGTNKK